MTDSSEPQTPTPQTQERPLDHIAPEPVASEAAPPEPVASESARGEREAPGRAPHGQSASNPRTHQTPGRSKGPPQDPEAFHRWIEIERLKIDMRRLEVESRRLDAPPSSREPVRHTGLTIAAIAGLVLMLLLLLGALVQIVLLRNEITGLRGQQTAVEQRLDDRLAALVDARLAALIPPPPVTSAPASPVLSSMAPAGAVLPAAGMVPAAPPPGADDATPAALEPPAKPAQLGTGYVVRMFAPTGAVPAARVEAFTNILKGAGFEVVVSDSGVVQPTANTLAYHAETAEVAEKLATLVQSKRPALDLELRTSSSIPENAKQVLILNVTEGALN